MSHSTDTSENQKKYPSKPESDIPESAVQPQSNRVMVSLLAAGLFVTTLVATACAVFAIANMRKVDKYEREAQELRQGIVSAEHATKVAKAEAEHSKREAVRLQGLAEAANLMAIRNKAQADAIADALIINQFDRMQRDKNDVGKDFAGRPPLPIPEDQREKNELPREIPADIKKKAIENLVKHMENVAPAIQKQLEQHRKLLPRLKAGIVVNRVNTLIPMDPSLPVNFPSKVKKEESIKACEVLIEKADEAMKAYDKKDIKYFAPSFPDNYSNFYTLGSVGRLPIRKVRTEMIIDNRTVMVALYPRNGERMRGEEAVITNIDSSKFVPGFESELHTILVVVGKYEGNVLLMELNIDMP